MQTKNVLSASIIEKLYLFFSKFRLEFLLSPSALISNLTHILFSVYIQKIIMKQLKLRSFFRPVKISHRKYSKKILPEQG